MLCVRRSTPTWPILRTCGRLGGQWANRKGSSSQTAPYAKRQFSRTCGTDMDCARIDLMVSLSTIASLSVLFLLHPVFANGAFYFPAFPVRRRAHHDVSAGLPHSKRRYRPKDTEGSGSLASRCVACRIHVAGTCQRRASSGPSTISKFMPSVIAPPRGKALLFSPASTLPPSGIAVTCRSTQA